MKPQQKTPPARYSKAELQEFQSLIQNKLATAMETLQQDIDSLQHLSSNATDDTYVGHPGMENGNRLMEREDLTRTIVRQEKFIQELKLALGRIRVGEYGVCRNTGKLIPKERLRVVPHATLTVEAKEKRPVPKEPLFSTTPEADRRAVQGLR